MRRFHFPLLLLLLAALIGTAHFVDDLRMKPAGNEAAKSESTSLQETYAESESEGQVLTEKETQTEAESESSSAFLSDVRGYYYEGLSEQEKAVYTAIFSGFLNTEQTFSVPNCSEERLVKLIHMVMNDHPELFWFEGTLSYRLMTDHCELTPVYRAEGRELAVLKDQLDTAVEDALSVIGTPADEVSLVEAVVSFLCENTAYVENAADNQNVLSCLVNHESVCAGYAKALSLLLHEYDIPAIVVSGELADGGAHAWNIVRIGDSYVHVDATFADPVTNTDQEVPGEVSFNRAWLFFDDSDMIRLRSIDMDLPVPACTDDSLDWYKRNGCFFTSPEDAEAAMEESVFSGAHMFTCRFSDYEVYEDFLSEIENGSYAQLVTRYLRDSASTSYTMDPAMYCVTVYY